MSMSKRQLLRVATDIQCQLRLLKRSRHRHVQTMLGGLNGHMARLQCLERKLTSCETRNWLRAWTKLVSMGQSVLNDVPHQLHELRRAIEACRTRVPSLGEIYAGLLQADHEFRALWSRCDQRLLVVETEAIELEEVYLGPFEIQLHIPSLADMRYHAVYNVVALDPHPASGNSGVTHPHVSEEHLCAGKAAAAIQAAVVSGRICDFFMLVRSVLTHYNPDSPYVSLDSWSGIACYECGYTVSEDSTLWCQACERDFCEECVSCCRRCQETTCLGCLKECTVCGDSICLGCIQACPVCEDPVCLPCLTNCPDCEQQLCKLCLEEDQCPCVQEETDNEQVEAQASAHETWEAEYQANINPEVVCGAVTCFGYAGYESVLAGYCTPEDLLGELEALDPDERQYILNELAGHQDLWKEGEQDGQ